MARVDTLPRLLGGNEAAARAALLLAAVLIAVATWLVLVRHARPAGGVAAGAGVLLLYGSAHVAGTPRRVVRFIDSVTDRAYDGALLPAIALSMRHTDQAAAAVAIAAVGASFVAAYIRARGRALGYTLRDSLLVRGARYAAVAIGLVADVLLGALIAVLVITTAAAIDGARQVTMQER